MATVTQPTALHTCTGEKAMYRAVGSANCVQQAGATPHLDHHLHLECSVPVENGIHPPLAAAPLLRRAAQSIHYKLSLWHVVHLMVLQTRQKKAVYASMFLRQCTNCIHKQLLPTTGPDKCGVPPCGRYCTERGLVAAETTLAMTSNLFAVVGTITHKKKLAHWIHCCGHA